MTYAQPEIDQQLIPEVASWCGCRNWHDAILNFQYLVYLCWFHVKFHIGRVFMWKMLEMDVSTSFVTDFLSESPSSCEGDHVFIGNSPCHHSILHEWWTSCDFYRERQILAGSLGFIGFICILNLFGSFWGLLVSFTWSSYAFNSVDFVVKLCLWGLSKCFCFQGMESLIKAECGVDVQELLFFQDMMYDMFYILTYNISKNWLSSPTCTLSAYQHNQKSMARWRTNVTFSLVVKKFRASKPWRWEKKWMSLGIQIRRSPKRPQKLTYELPELHSDFFSAIWIPSLIMYH